MKIGSPCLLLAKCWVIIHHIVNHTDMDHMDVLYIQGSIKLDAAPILPCLHFHLLEINACKAKIHPEFVLAKAQTAKLLKSILKRMSSTCSPIFSTIPSTKVPVSSPDVQPSQLSMWVPSILSWPRSARAGAR